MSSKSLVIGFETALRKFQRRSEAVEIYWTAIALKVLSQFLTRVYRLHMSRVTSHLSERGVKCLCSNGILIRRRGGPKLIITCDFWLNSRSRDIQLTAVLWIEKLLICSNILNTFFEAQCRVLTYCILTDSILIIQEIFIRETRACRVAILIYVRDSDMHIGFRSIREAVFVDSVTKISSNFIINYL